MKVVFLGVTRNSGISVCFGVDCAFPTEFGSGLRFTGGVIPVVCILIDIPSLHCHYAFCLSQDVFSDIIRPVPFSAVIWSGPR